MLFSSVHKITLSTALLALGWTAYGQTGYKQKIRFLQDAPCVLPTLQKDHKWPQMQNFLDHWDMSQSPSEELIFGIRTLMAIEQRNFTAVVLPPHFEYFLQDYAREVQRINDSSNSFRYYLRISNRQEYDATPDAKSLIAWMRTWSNRLLSDPLLSPTEVYLCKIYAGEIGDPQRAMRPGTGAYPELDSVQINLDKRERDYFVSQRNQGGTTASVMIGAWMPTGHLTALGAHPSIGLMVGGRNKLNEYDIVWAFRFIGPTPEPYTFSRNDTLHVSSYYDGGYIGFDYTRYLIHRTRYEFGVVSALAYDYFSVASGFGDNTETSHWGSLNEGSLDFNNGFRFKYFVRPHTSLGIVLKYHIINYDNRGGSNLGGNAFTLDLSYGLR
jgi:hypothetical protein